MIIRSLNSFNLLVHFKSVIAIALFSLPCSVVAEEFYECFLKGNIYNSINRGFDEAGIDYAEFDLKLISHSNGDSTAVEFCDDALDMKLSDAGLVRIKVNRPGDIVFMETDLIELSWRRLEYSCPSGWCYLDGFSVLNKTGMAY